MLFRSPLLYFSAIAGAAFGSIHCAAWNFDFSSHVEQIMWRIASVTLVGACLSVFLGDLVQKLATSSWATGDGSFLRPLNYHSRYNKGIKIIAFIPTIVYPVARLTLLILALLSLRRLPHSALQTVTWTEFIPHI